VRERDVVEASVEGRLDLAGEVGGVAQRGAHRGPDLPADPQPGAVDAVYRLALRMTADAGDAEEVTQDVFLSAWRRLPEIREDAAFSGWLYRTATNRCLNLLRRRRPTSELDDQVPNQVEADPQRATQSSAQLEALVAALQHLTPEQRAVWLLREAHHRSYEEIAQVVGTTPQAVRGRLSRARAQLAELMSPWR
jgi:RNA polymerase sigma-70 factor (ECF subfamily)